MTVIGLFAALSKIKAHEYARNKKITQDVESGQLAKKEAGALNAEQSTIRNDDKNMKSDGTLPSNYPLSS